MNDAHANWPWPKVELKLTSDPTSVAGNPRVGLSLKLEAELPVDKLATAIGDSRDDSHSKPRRPKLVLDLTADDVGATDRAPKGDLTASLEGIGPPSQRSTTLPALAEAASRFAAKRDAERAEQIAKRKAVVRDGSGNPRRRLGGLGGPKNRTGRGGHEFPR